jgi:hypothetical protein
MKWEDISTELLAFSREPILEEPSPAGFPLPEELLRNRREWAKIVAQPPGAALTSTERPYRQPVSSHHRRQKLIVLIGSGIAALLMIGVLGLSLRQQAATNRQLKRSQADLARLQEQNAKVGVALAARESENADLRRQTADADDVRRRLQNVTVQLEKARNRPAWPPDAFVLTGVINEGSNTRKEDTINVIAWLQRRAGGQYVGFLMPVDKLSDSPMPVEIKGAFVDKYEFAMAEPDNKVLKWPELTAKTDGPVVQAPPPNSANTPQTASTPRVTRVSIDVDKRTFTGTMSGVAFRGKITF